MNIDLKNRPLPENLGEAVDLLHDVRDLRLAMSKETDSVGAYESALREHIIGNLDKREEGGVAGKRYRATRTEKRKPIVAPANWGAFFGWVQESGRFDCLQKRLSDKAVMDLIADDKTPPGVEIFNAIDISLTKL